MLFCNCEVEVYSNKKTFLNDYWLSYGTLATFRKNRKISPNTPSSIDRKRHSSFIKLHQEYLERTRIAHNYSNIDEVKSFNLINQDINSIKRSDIFYGYNELYGVMDTTGTASGLKSALLKEKSILELIEKNEGLLLWYKLLGYRVKKTDEINKLIKSIGFYSDEIFIYAAENILNIPSFFIFLVSKGKIMATGASCNQNQYAGLKNALLEAKLLESVNREDSLYCYKELDDAGVTYVYQHIQKLETMLEEKQYDFCNHNELVYPNWIESLEVAVLNTKSYQEWVTIRCFSKDLVNSIPIKENIMKSMEKKIFKVFKLEWEEIDKIPSCIIM